MLPFRTVLFMLALVSIILSPARLAPYYNRCLSYCAPGDLVCKAKCDTAAGK